MPFNYAKNSKQKTRETCPIKATVKPVDKPQMVKNSDVGFVFKLDPMALLDRFLILGSESPTYYATARKLTEDNAKNVAKLIKTRPRATLDRIVEISKAGRAPKNDAAIFALSLFYKHADFSFRSAVAEVANEILRTFTHLTTFMGYVKNWHSSGSSSMRHLLSKWYNGRAPAQVVYQLLKYGTRQGWNHKDIITVGHIKPSSDDLGLIFKFIFGKATEDEMVKFPAFAHDKALREAENENNVVKLITSSPTQWEQIPTQWLKSPKVWDALLPNMQYIATIRNLARITACGAISSMNPATKYIVGRILDKEQIVKSKVHPIQVLAAWGTYKQGYGDKGSLTWIPEKHIVDALEEAFVLAFHNVEPTGKNIMLGLDVSGSMQSGMISGLSGLTPALATGCMTHLYLKTEKWVETRAFSSNLMDPKVSSKDSLDGVLRKLSNLSFSSTNPGLLIQYATREKLPVDCFIVMTDNEMNEGRHPFQLLKQFRQIVNPKAKMVVIGMTSTNFTIADPNDPGSLDVVGFDSYAPSIIGDFIRQ